MPSSPRRADVRFDLVSVGGGLAGLVAALRAAELGLAAGVIEAGRGERYPCNSRIAGGILHAAYQDVTRDPAALLDGLLAAGACDESLAGVIASQAGRALDWLRTQGVRFAHFPQNRRGAWIMAPPRPRVTGMRGGEAWVGRGPDRALRVLTQRLRERSGRLVEGMRGERLRMEGGRCAGVVARGSEGTLAIDAGAVVLADGGFAGNAALFRRHIGPAPERVLQRGAGTGVGDALRMACEADAMTCGLDRFYGHLLSRDAFSNDLLWPYPQIDAVAAAGIVVDTRGERLFDEGLGGIHAANHLASLDDPLCATAILDAAIWGGPGRLGLVAPNPELVHYGATIHVAPDLARLADACGIARDRLASTVRTYNDALASGTLARLTPTRSESKAKAMPIGQPPFMAIPLCAGITNTMGGLAIDAHAQVLDTQRRPIAGLYAAGATTGGLEGGPGVAYVGGLVKAVVFGLQAAEHAASLHELTTA